MSTHISTHVYHESERRGHYANELNHALGLHTTVHMFSYAACMGMAYMGMAYIAMA